MKKLNEIKLIIFLPLLLLSCTNRNVFEELPFTEEYGFVYVDGSSYCAKYKDLLKDYIISDYFNQKFSIHENENIVSYDINYISVKNNLLYFVASEYINNTPSMYYFDSLDFKTEEIIEINQISHDYLYEKTTISEIEKNECKYTFSEGFTDLANFDCLIKIYGSTKSSNDLLFETIIDLNTKLITYFGQPISNSYDEEKECLKKTGAIIKDSSGIIEYKNIKYVLDDEYLIKHSDYYETLRNNVFTSYYSNKFVRCDNKILLISSGNYGLPTYLPDAIFILDLESMYCKYLGNFSCNKMIGVITL